MKWILDNKDWIFSGIGIAIFGGIIKFLFKKRKKTEGAINQSIDKGSNNYQAGRDNNVKR